jgi:adenylosuccinate lyase
MTELNIHQINQNQKLFEINALCPLDGRYAYAVKKLHHFLSEKALMQYRIQVEIEWLINLSESSLDTALPNLTPEQKKYLRSLYLNFSNQHALCIKYIESITNHDVKAIEYWIKENIGVNLDSLNLNQADYALVLANHEKPYAQYIHTLNAQELSNTTDIFKKCAEFVHFACTSEDINNLAHALMLKNAREILLESTQEIIKTLKNMAHSYADIAMLSRTHGQSASPTTVGKEFANVCKRLQDIHAHIATISLQGKINGAVGNYNAHIVAYPEFNWQLCAKNLIENIFNIQHNAFTTQIEPHDYMAELFHAIMRFNTILIDFNRDIWGYISLGYFKQKVKAGEIGSSTMPHKVNPIDFENSEGNLGMANAILGHLAEKLPISRWQRDLTDSTVLRNMGMGFGYSLLAYTSCLRGLAKLNINEQVILNDLNTCWEVLAEPIQTVMRKHRIEQAYEKLKELTRGKDGINEQSIRAFILELDIPELDKNNLLTLTPAKYIGLAATLAKSI